MEWELFFSKTETSLSIEITEHQKAQFKIFYKFLVIYNRKVNLTSNTDLTEILNNHFYDSAMNLKFLDFNNKKVADIGTGAGFPAIVIKILTPSVTLYMFESITKKVKYLDELVDVLELDNTYVINKRVEECRKEFLRKFDICTLRAVGNIEKCIHFALPIIKKSSFIALMKGPKYVEELEAFKLSSTYRNCEIKEINLYNLINLSILRYILIFVKM